MASTLWLKKSWTMQNSIQNNNSYLEKLSSINLIVSLIFKSKMNVPNLGPFFCPNKIS